MKITDLSFFHRAKVRKEAVTKLSEELQHINREMYKKSVELAETNKTLSILRKIDDIILGSVTDIQEISQQVTTILVAEAKFKIVSIFLLNKEEKMLSRVGITEDQTVQAAQRNVAHKVTYSVNIPLSQDDMLIVQAVKGKKLITTARLYDIHLHDAEITPEQAGKIQEASGIKSSIIAPLIVRNEVLGAMIVSLTDVIENLTEYQKDLLKRLINVIGIALDNALLYNKVQESNEKLKALDKLKDEFVSVASHELRTPMTAIKSYTWMALAGKGGPLTEKQRYYMDRAYGATDRLIKLVNDMLNISRIESGRLILDLQAIHMEALIADVIEDIKPRAAELGVTVQFEKEESLPEVLIDQDSIKEVLINLIGNSLKFTPRGGTITISVAAKDGMIETQIKDTGVGIEKEDMDKLFQKFGLISGSYATNQKAQGTGLGLYICKQIITMHGGKIWAASEGKEKGSTFTFSLKVFNEEKRSILIKTHPEKEEHVRLIPTEI